MQQINSVDIETVWGYKSVELYEGNILDISTGIDILGFSVYADHYKPTPGTMVAALHAANVHPEELINSCEIDYRKVFGCWVSKPIEKQNFNRLICAELQGGSFNFEDVIANIFIVLSVLEMKGIDFKSFALPPLGTGRLKIAPDKIIELLLNHSTTYLERSKCLQKVMFVTNQKDHAYELSAAIDKALGRSKLVLPKTDIIDSCRNSIKQIAYDNLSHDSTKIFHEIIRTLSDKEVRVSELEHTGRRVAEFLVSELYDLVGTTPKSTVLYQNIDGLKKSVPDWIVASLHVLRTLGNDSVHLSLTPNDPLWDKTTADVEMGLVCMKRSLAFWVALKQSKGR